MVGREKVDSAPKNVKHSNAPLNEPPRGDTVAVNGSTVGAGKHDGKIETDASGKSASFGPTDVYTYSESLTAIFVEPVKVAAVYGIIIATIDFYETINATGTDGAEHTT